jgi:hypothetical protein
LNRPNAGVFIFGRGEQFLPVQDSKSLFELLGQNSGNVAFQHAVNSHLSGNLPIVDKFASPEEISEQGHVGVFPAANHFGSHVNFSRLAERFTKLDCRIVMIGLGAQSDLSGRIPQVPDGTVEWIRSIADRSLPNVPNISLRGQISKKILDHYGFSDSTEVLGCPSLFTNPDPQLGKQIQANVRPIKRVAVAAGHERWLHLARIEQSLTSIVTATGGSYIGQSAFNMFRLARGEAREMEESELRACRDYACPQMGLDEFVTWSERHGCLFFDVPSWMEHYRRFDFVIGPRIHGVMLGLQAGIPGVVIAHDSRTLELCETMMVPYVRSKEIKAGITMESLPELFKFDGAAFDKNRRMLAQRYVAFLDSNELDPKPWLREIAL